MKKGGFRQKLMDNVYVIGLRECNANDSKYTVCIPPSIRYWYADPILCEIENTTFLFAEQYDRFQKHGFLAAFEVKKSKDVIFCSKPKRIIAEKFHLSFPLIFPYAGEYYLIPESSEDNSLRIYKMGTSVYEWTLIRRIPMQDSVDTVMVQMDDCVFFINTEEHPTRKIYGKQKIYRMENFPNGELSLMEESDSYSLVKRNGGGLFYDGAALIRVCQNCTDSFYGKSFSLYEVKNLSGEGGYHDELIQTVEAENLMLDLPERKYEIRGTHTYSKTSRYETVDLFCNFYSVWNVFAKFIRKFF